jgi:DNA-binding winged helix-turn-helix (wHTH) protein
VGIRFGAFTLNLKTRQLVRDGSAIHLAPKAFQLLATLVAERPNVISKAVLQQRLWPDTFVAEANLSNLVAELREALGDRTRDACWIRTVHRVGYAFSGEAVDDPASDEPALGRPAGWLEWGRRRFHLFPGDHVIGRDPDVAIRLDESTVSRRHARVVVSDRGTWLEDFGSKNGTLRGGERVAARVPLADGDVIYIGSVRLTFRNATRFVSTETVVAGP